MKKYLAVFVLLLSVVVSTASIIKVNTVLEITVFNHPEFSGRYLVSETGSIEYPLFSDDPVVNISTSELQNTLTFRLAKYIDNPLVTVSVVQKPEIIVTILGQVKTPGPIKSYEGASIQEVLAQGGGPLEGANLEKIKIIHQGGRPSDIEFFNLTEFLKTGDISNAPMLKNNDVVMVLTMERNKKAKIIGGVRNPGFFDVTTSLNVFELIYMAGGPADKADLSRVRRFSEHDGKTFEEVLDVQTYIDKGEMGSIPKVEQGDVVIVYTKWFDWSTLLTIMNNVLLFIVTAQTFGGIFK